MGIKYVCDICGKEAIKDDQRQESVLAQPLLPPDRATLMARPPLPRAMHYHEPLQFLACSADCADQALMKIGEYLRAHFANV